MIYNDKTNLAMKIAYDAHAGRLDKNGVPYIFHPYHVAESMTDENTTIVALLHDVIEDTTVSIKKIKEYGFNNDVIEALSVITHDKSVPYLDYIKKVKENEIARKVKIADLKHNMDETRLKDSKKNSGRMEKYKKALRILTATKLDELQDTLKVCKCGRHPLLVKDNDEHDGSPYYYVRCIGCMTLTEDYYNAEGAVNAWNNEKVIEI